MNLKILNFFWKLLFFFATASQAQPWLSNRYAQNCSGCHSPSRYNQEASERRCTLSCQGCHVNPNGGGIRSRYGVWNSQRWLRTFKVDWLSPKGIPLPRSHQKYDKLSDVSVESLRKIAKKGFALQTTDQLDYVESNYDKYAEDTWKTIAENHSVFMSRLSSTDPYREERSMPITAGGDFRYFAISRLDGNVTNDRRFSSWLMNVDLGVRVRPLPEKLSAVFETRYLGQPTENNITEGFTTEARIRSAYLMLDELPYNTYLMAGIYRPMFGLYTPDHTSINQVVSGLTQRARYTGFSIGSAPNVPFFNAHFLTKNPNQSDDQSSGIVLNLGGRFVTAGLSGLLSYWKTKNDASGTALSKEMISVSLGAMVWRFIYNTEILRVSDEFSPGAYDAGVVFTNKLLFRAWREIYIVLNEATSNVALNRKSGWASEYMFGVKSYLLPGTEVELLASFRKNHVNGTTLNQDGLQTQFHLFF